MKKPIQQGAEKYGKANLPVKTKISCSKSHYRVESSHGASHCDAMKRKPR